MELKRDCGIVAAIAAGYKNETPKDPCDVEHCSIVVTLLMPLSACSRKNNDQRCAIDSLIIGLADH